jgi:hypothetical protein
MKNESIVFANTLEHYKILFNVSLKKNPNEMAKFRKLVWHYFFFNNLFWFIFSLIMVVLLSYCYHLYANEDIGALWKLSLVVIFIYLIGRYIGCKKIVEKIILNKASESLGEKKCFLCQDKLILESLTKANFEYINDINILYEDQSIIIFKGIKNAFIIPKNGKNNNFIEEIHQKKTVYRKRQHNGAKSS